MKDILKQREERIKILIERGYTADIETGKVYNIKGKEVTYKMKSGYLAISTKITNQKSIIVLQHQFIFYKAKGKVVDEIDHINGYRTDNRIENLREVTHEENNQNRTNVKGYTWNKIAKKWQAQIMANGDKLHLKYWNTEEEARQAYLEAKKIYHII